MDVPLTEKLALNIREVTALTGVCRTELYEAIAAGALLARKRGASTLVLQADLRAWLDRLPAIGPSGAGKAAGAGEAEPAAEMGAAPAPAPASRRRRRLELIAAGGQRT
ncbi:helix-turn-helix domain-containing protein [Bradyrhizobium sp. LB11.1]|uniref:helix-turn-helix domain-containing protein n=1 Tax=Bradyrhizobium sp. LB11.1 TaxID=3156326 RepID=UPI0033938CBD